jgi:hypothetical protein
VSKIQFEGLQSTDAFNRLFNDDAWLISITIASCSVRLVCDFMSTESSEYSYEKSLYFNNVSHLDFSYEQNVFGTEENDISTIDVAKICKEEDVAAKGRWRVSFELTYGRLEFSFGALEIIDLPNGPRSRVGG